MTIWNTKFTRRQFLATLTVSGVVSVFSSPGFSQSPSLKPPRLQKGDRIGLISPAGATFIKEELQIVIEAFHALGLTPQLAPHLLDRYGYLAGKDRDRAADINRFFADEAIAVLISSRVLHYLDYKIIRRHLKLLTFYSKAI